MKVLVTGVRGFIGSVMCARLVHFGHEAIGLDSGDRGLNDVTKIKGSFKFYQHDCREGIHDFLAMENIDAVVHLAAGTGSLSRPYEELVELNVKMTQTLYHNACNSGVPMFVYPMTSLSLDSLLMNAPYVRSKQDGMDWLLQQNEVTKVIPLMFFNQVGAYKGLTEYRKHEVHVLPALLDCFLNEKPFVINGDDYGTPDGTPARDYTNVINTVDFIIYLIEKHLGSNLPTYTSPIQLGTGTQTTTLQLVNYFRELIGDINVQIGPRRPFDTGFVQCDSTVLRDFHRRSLILARDSCNHEWTTLLELLLPSKFII